MARIIGRLTTRTVASLAAPGRYSDGANLYLSISPNGGKRWTFLFQRNGRQVELGLGSARIISLAKAREIARAMHEKLVLGEDPRAVRKPVSSTFGDVADALLKSLEPSFRNEKHRDQWRMTLTDHAARLRPLAINAITTEDVLAVLKPMWTKTPETASRLRGRIERVLDAATARGLRTGDNPARWRGHLDSLLPKRATLTRGHHAALPFKDMPAFMTALRQRPAMAALALEFAILTAARTGEVIGAVWDEIDEVAKLWTVPAERMKAKKEHRVPLSDRALAVLAEAKKARLGDFIFPTERKDAPLSNMALTALLRRMERDDITVHGFRSTFRDWAGEATDFPREIAEAALAHTLDSKVERAYRRGDALEKRRELMTAWGDFIH
jgi:integrase